MIKINFSFLKIFLWFFSKIIYLCLLKNYTYLYRRTHQLFDYFFLLKQYQIISLKLSKQFDKLTKYTSNILKQVFQFIDFIQKIKEHKDFSTKILRILKEIVDKYSSSFQQSSTQWNTKFCSSNIAIFFSFFEKWIIDNSTRRKAIKNFIKILLNIEKTAAKLSFIDYRITSLNEFLANSKNMRVFDIDKNKNKQRKLIEDINNQDANIDFSQTQDFNQTQDSCQIQRAESNHESYIKTSQFQALSLEMKARIVKLMQQIMIIFMKAHSNDSFFVHSIFQAERSHFRFSLYDQTSSFKWNPSNIGFFDPHFNEKIIAIASVMKHSEKDIYFRNIHLFLKRCSNIATIKGDQIVRNNLFICLRELALQWYISEMTSNVKALIKYASGIEHWFVKLLSRFKKKSIIALSILMREKYTFKDAKNQRKFREYAFIILRATKSINLETFDQIAMIWNDMNTEFQRDIQRSNEDIVLDDFLNALDEFKNIWWQLTRRRMSVFKNSNYRSNQYQYSKKRSDQYQQSEKEFKSCNISESFEEYRKNYSRANSTSNFKSNSNNMQQYFKSWTLRTSYQFTRQSYQQKKDRQAFKDIENSSKFSKSTDVSKSQHSIYNKFQRYSIDSQRINPSYQQKASHENEDEKLKDDEEQENFSFNFANFDDEDNELYYEKESIKEDDNDQIFIEFIDIESTCKRCELFFFSRNLLHVHIREAKCLKQTISTNPDTSKTHNIVKIIAFKAFTKDQNSELKFRSWNFFQTFIKLISTMKAILMCLNIECDATLADKAWIIDLLSNIQIRKMQTSLRVKGIESFTHEFIEYVCISVYFSGITKNEFSALAFITKEIHLIDDLKVKMLIENDLLRSEEFIINIEKKIFIIDSCDMNIALETQSKGSYIRKMIHA